MIFLYLQFWKFKTLGLNLDFFAAKSLHFSFLRFPSRCIQHRTGPVRFVCGSSDGPLGMEGKIAEVQHFFFLTSQLSANLKSDWIAGALRGDFKACTGKRKKLTGVEEFKERSETPRRISLNFDIWESSFIFGCPWKLYIPIYLTGYLSIIYPSLSPQLIYWSWKFQGDTQSLS